MDPGNLAYLERMFGEWRRDPGAVPPEWAAFFSRPEAAAPPAAAAPSGPAGAEYRQTRVDSLMWAFRDVGHFHARLDPLAEGREPGPEGPGGTPPEEIQRLTPEEFGLSDADLDEEFFAGPAMRPSRMTLRSLLEAFRQTYCASVGVEFLHLRHKGMRRWLIDRMESARNRPDLSAAERRTVLEDLIRVEELERFLHVRFVGQKRFSLEGCETAVPALHFLVDLAAKSGVTDLVLGATHRGRLSILNRILDLPPEEIFASFEEHEPPVPAGISGDVKYHRGYDARHQNEDGSEIRISLVPNASHLESVDGVVLGKARALQDRLGPGGDRKVLPVILHGDAAFSGQGVVSEVFNLSGLEGYRTGGTIHLVINNQIGFTTPARSARSTRYPTDAAKMLETPIFHVNGDDPEAAVHAARIALEFRQRFARDVVLDVVGYRRHGHSEIDEPAFTQPRMVRLISERPSAVVAYGRLCAERGVLPLPAQEELREDARRRLREALERERAGGRDGGTEKRESVPEGAGAPATAATAVPADRLKEIARRLFAIPPGFPAHPKLAQILRGKLEALKAGRLDWATAEVLAFATLLLEGTPVRLSGEDSVLGTFSQRHLVWWDPSGDPSRSHAPLDHLGEGQARLHAFDSPLSEFSVLGFEFGYSLASPKTLTIWEAQYGDFADGAQAIIDNYLASAEGKWGTPSGLALLLPHGYEGQGPDHSSAYPERFLQLCARDNLEVANPTEPAQYFHLLRRQARRDIRKPLVVMAPKSLLRHPRAVSPLSALSEGRFREVLADPPPGGARPARILFCSGKVYYDLLAARESGPGGPVREATILSRLERLYPFPREALAGLLEAARSGGAAPDLVWVQEEPRNMGAWRFARERFADLPGSPVLRYVGREESDSKAVGSHRRHVEEQQDLIRRAFEP